MLLQGNQGVLGPLLSCVTILSLHSTSVGCNRNLVLKAQYIIIYFIPNIHIKSTTFENERTRLIFEGGGDSGGISKEQPPTKTSVHGSFSRRVGGSSVGKEHPPSKTNHTGSFSRVEVVVLATGGGKALQLIT